MSYVQRTTDCNHKERRERGRTNQCRYDQRRVDEDGKSKNNNNVHKDERLKEREKDRLTVNEKYRLNFTMVAVFTRPTDDDFTENEYDTVAQDPT